MFWKSKSRKRIEQLESQVYSLETRFLNLAKGIEQLGGIVGIHTTVHAYSSGEVFLIIPPALRSDTPTVLSLIKQ